MARPGGVAAAGLVLSIALLWLSTTSLAAIVPGAPDEPVDAEVERGETLYRLYCASCHGKEGKGDGPVASALVVRPTNLTRLARKAGGEFPKGEVRAAIDGRTEVAGHGTREMPVWGLSFAERGRDASQEREIAAEIDALVSYLGSIQRR